MRTVVRRHSRVEKTKGKTMKNKIKIIIGELIVYTVSVLFLAGCAGQKQKTFYSLQEAAESTDFSTAKEHTGSNGTAEEDTVAAGTFQETVFVHICGEVVNPGVYEVECGSRICDVLVLAGGFTDNAATDLVNMAAPAEDGMQVVIPSVAQMEANARPLAESSDSHPVNINTADKERLMTLPGIGESRAEAILTYRQEKGRFSKTEDIMQVDGIKEGLYNKIKDKICVN